VMNHPRSRSMTLLNARAAVQLDLPLQPSVSAELPPDQLQAVKEALAALLLSAAGVTQKEQADER